MPGKAKIVALIFFLILPLKSALAADFSVEINEICWMGDKNKTANEWIELYNNQNQNVSLEGWILKIDDTKIQLKGGVPAQGFYLISRDQSKSADLYFNKALRNTGNRLILLDSQNNIIDQMDWTAGWPQGDNKTKQTMEKIRPRSSGNIETSWQTSENPGGTPKQKNSPGKTEAQVNKNDTRQTDKDLAPPNNFPVSFETILGAALISIFSGAIVLLIKKCLNRVS